MQKSTNLRVDTANLEPDETWKAALRERIEVKLGDMVKEAKESLKAGLKDLVGAEGRDVLTSKYHESMQDIRKIATEKFNTALGRERQERRWAAGLAMAPEWAEILAREQQEIMDRIKHNRKANGSWGDRAGGMRSERAEVQGQDQQTMHSSDSWEPDPFREECKRLESERRAQTMEMYATYERQWSRLATMDELRWDSFPWPTPTMPSTPVEITASAVRKYILSPDFPGPPLPITERVDEYIQRWHPDQFGGGLFAKVAGAGREMVLEGAWAVIIGLKDIQREEARRNVAEQRKEAELRQGELEMRRREAAEWKATEARLLEEKAQVEMKLVRALEEVRSKEEEIRRREQDIKKRGDEHNRHDVREDHEAKSEQERRRGDEERFMERQRAEVREWEQQQRKHYEREQQNFVEEGEEARLRKVKTPDAPWLSPRDLPRGDQHINNAESATGHSSAADTPKPSPTSSALNPLPMREGRTEYTEKGQPPIFISAPSGPSGPTSAFTEKARLREIKTPSAPRSFPSNLPGYNQDTDNAESATGYSSATDTSKPPTSSILNPPLMREGRTEYTEKGQPPIFISAPSVPSGEPWFQWKPKVVEEKHKEKARSQNVKRSQTPWLPQRDPPRNERAHQGTDDAESVIGHSSATDTSWPPSTPRILNPLPARAGRTKFTGKAQPPIIITPPGPSASTSASTATPSPLSEESWARRQTEFAERQREDFRREQERLESERQSRLKRARTPERAVNPIFATHQRQWEVLSTLDELRWGAFPWPLLKPPSGPHEITLTAINAYIISPERDGTQTTKDRVREHLRRWHPDRFETKFLGRVVRSEQETVKLGAAAVTRSLSTLLTQLNTHTLYA
ncbi:hypothetical protein BD779DRAFT_1025484 [Infundibulicybe gibba]|nr:hypothetical protein BD779DRAFT_1025484 [Infundibulicybe gibba]